GDRENNEVSVGGRVSVRGALHPDHRGKLARPVRAAGADRHLLAERVQPLGERAAERSGAAQDRDSHLRTAAASRTASATRRRPSISGLTATAGTRRRSSAARIPATARIGAMLRYGLLGASAIRSADSSASTTPGAGCASPS